MEKVVFAEILNWRGGVRNRVRIDRFPVTIGRSYGNDIIADDRFICPEHFKVYFDEHGTLIAEDLGSVNGIHQVKPPAKVTRLELGPDTVLRAGHTSFRFRQGDYKTPPAEMERSGWRNTFRPFDNTIVALLIISATIGVLLLDSYLSSYRQFEASEFLDVLFGMGIVFLLWTGFWSILSRIVSHSFRLLSHLTLICALVIVIFLFNTVYEYLEYVFLLPEYVIKFKQAVFLLWGTAVLFGHMSIVTTSKPVKRLVFSFLISALIVGGMMVSDYLDSRDFSSYARFSSTIKPVESKMLKSMPSEEFFAGTEELRQKVDKLADEWEEQEAEAKKTEDSKPEEDVSEDSKKQP